MHLETSSTVLYSDLCNAATHTSSLSPTDLGKEQVCVVNIVLCT